jgi:curved DNA-binding protein
MAKRDYYEVLGVGRSASDEEIRRAHRKLAKQYHPDRNRNDKSAEARFREVQEAYEILSDKDKRAIYDKFGHSDGPGTWQRGPTGQRVYHYAGDTGQSVDFGNLEEIFEFFSGGRGGQRGGSGFEDLFNGFSGFGGRQTRTARRPVSADGQDAEQAVELTFEQAIHGTQVELQLLKTDGAARSRETITVKIPPGVDDGQRIRVRGKGQSGTGSGRSGDLYIVCRVRPHPYFRREGANIVLDVPISITEAALGTRIDLPTIDGISTVTIPPGTASGTKLRLKGKGVRTSRDSGRGDQFVLIRIVPPKSLTSEEKRLLEQLSDTLSEDPRANAPWK